MDREDAGRPKQLDEIDNWVTFFEEVRRYPGMWIGRKSTTALEHLLGGMILAQHIYGIPEDRVLKGFDFEAFETWVHGRFNLASLSINSFSMARQASKGEADAFDRWFEWYDEFRSETGGA